jgi:hypothetical protein
MGYNAYARTALRGLFQAIEPHKCVSHFCWRQGVKVYTLTWLALSEATGS